MEKSEYDELVKQASPGSPSYKTVPAAFFVGGFICFLGQVLMSIYESAGLAQKEAAAAVSCTLIAVGVLLTAFRVFEKIALFSGAGTLVPITGFANSIAAPAIEYKTEGAILGTCVKMFTIAGPVLTCGITASVIYGVILCLMGKSL